ncbi:MAG: PEP/pyruvate-binding domain-containing protein [Candidatus Omnitrophota bacterium]
MEKASKLKSNTFITRFNRDFYSEKEEFSYIGDGVMGGKAAGLASIKEKIVYFYENHPIPAVHIHIPRLVVITTQFFDLFLKENNLADIAFADLTDERMAYHFLKAELPASLIGDLWALIQTVHLPLAIRSSSLMEDSLNQPFAGIYATKMIPNNQSDVETRFRKLTEAIKFVYASTFFQSAKSYMKTTAHRLEDEKMAVIIQEVVGMRHNDRFYPTISGVARSYNFYPTGHAAPEDGVVNLALGLGKTIVDGGAVWTYSPEYPETSPPYNSIHDLLTQTQLDFWAIHMGLPPIFDPTQETEYLTQLSLKDAEYDNALTYIASTYDCSSDRLTIGTGCPGPRVLNFAPILQVELLPVNRAIQSVLHLCEERFGTNVEIEFALSIASPGIGRTNARFGVLQVRPMALNTTLVELDERSWSRERVLAASNNVMGNGRVTGIRDIVYVDPHAFQLSDSREIAQELDAFNRQLVEAGAQYLLIGFGRWGTSDPWLGIPANWGQISGARIIIESQLPGIAVDFSQGSHFFHNMSNLGILYFSLKREEPYPIDWAWLQRHQPVRAATFIRHVHLPSPLTVEVDGRTRQGVIFKNE